MDRLIDSKDENFIFSEFRDVSLKNLPGGKLDLLVNNLEDRTVSTVEEIEFNSRSTFKGGFNMLDSGYKTTYVANANKFEIYNPEDELIGTYTIHTTEKVTEDDVATLTTEELEYEEDIEEEFFYRAVVATTEEMQSFVEINN